MTITIYDPAFKRADISTQKIITTAIKRLETRLNYYVKDNIRIENVFNDDILKHDVIDGIYYVYKCVVGRVQLRILYVYQNDELIIIDHFHKNRTTKEYLKSFETSVYNYKKHMKIK